MLGYGWAGLFRKFLVDSPYMWWPSNLVQVSLFRSLSLSLSSLEKWHMLVFVKMNFEIYTTTNSHIPIKYRQYFVL